MASAFTTAPSFFAKLAGVTTIHKNAPRGAYPRPARRNPVTGCPLTAAFAAIGGKWKLILIYWLSQGSLHFAGVQRLMPSISHKVLTQQLRELEADGIVKRTPLGEVPAPVMYELTDYGSTLLPLVEAVREWGRGHLERKQDPAAKSKRG
jgi:DNA-binding HxlR family transcriptional regulator